MTAYILALLSLTAHAESCEKQYEQARANGAGNPWCHSVAKPDSLAGDYCLVFEGPTIAPSPVPTVKPLSSPKRVNVNPSAKAPKP